MSWQASEEQVQEWENESQGFKEHGERLRPQTAKDEDRERAAASEGSRDLLNTESWQSYVKKYGVPTEARIIGHGSISGFARRTLVAVEPRPTELPRSASAHRWLFHNTIAHFIAGLLWYLSDIGIGGRWAEKWGDRLHDATVPKYDAE